MHRLTPLHYVWLDESERRQKKDRITQKCRRNKQRERNHWKNIPEPNIIPFNTSNDTPQLSVSVSDDKESIDKYSFSGPNAESEVENIDFGTDDQPQAAPHPPDPPLPAQNRDPEGDRSRRCGRGHVKQYPDPFGSVMGNIDCGGQI